MDSPIAAGWESLLVDAGYAIAQTIPVYTQRYGGLHNAEKRADYEVIIVAERKAGNR